MTASSRLADALRRINLLNNIEVSLADNNTNSVLWNNFRHLVEETGEMARCLRGTNDEPMANEAVDAAICAFACALLDVNGDIESIIEIMHTKLDKWENAL